MDRYRINTIFYLSQIIRALCILVAFDLAIRGDKHRGMRFATSTAWLVSVAVRWFKMRRTFRIGDVDVRSWSRRTSVHGDEPEARDENVIAPGSNDQLEHRRKIEAVRCRGEVLDFGVDEVRERWWASGRYHLGRFGCPMVMRYMHVLHPGAYTVQAKMT